MDALDVLMNLQKAFPYYQPIISADGHNIFGYEVLGRIETDEGIQSLGPFFHDPHVPDEYKREVNEHLVKIALEEFMNYEEETTLFINVNPNTMMEDSGDKLIEILSSYENQGLKHNQIVVEIKEHEYRGDISRLAHLFRYLQTHGIKVALDDVGKGSSNLDRIGILEPNLLKVDIHSLKKKQQTLAYHGVLYSLSLLARKIGADLVFEGIETNHQMHYAWRNHGRYFQGFFLAKPDRTFLPGDYFKDRFRQDIHQFILMERRKIEAQYELSSRLNEYIQKVLKETKKNQDLDYWMLDIAQKVSEFCFRIYICDEDGFQQTGNGFQKHDGHWALHPDYKGKNWSWRPYFIENIIRMNDERKGILSDVYSDIETGELIRTFSYPLNRSQFLFMDLPHAYLYEHDVIAW
ncbi:MAG: EAL domain-containing protein [Bacillaceae bacterium]|nr:EAL domain-containing protein [Bacillaceae bacterium]